MDVKLSGWEDAKFAELSKEGELSKDAGKFGKRKPKTAFENLIDGVDTYVTKKFLRIFQALTLFMKGMAVEMLPDAIGKKVLPPPPTFQEKR